LITCSFHHLLFHPVYQKAILLQHKPIQFQAAYFERFKARNLAMIIKKTIAERTATAPKATLMLSSYVVAIKEKRIVLSPSRVALRPNKKVFKPLSVFILKASLKNSSTYQSHKIKPYVLLWAS